MLRSVLLTLFITSSFLTHAQIRLVKLEVAKNEKYLIQGADVLDVDTLVMRDSSEIVLNPLKKDNFIHAKVTRIGKSCIISGKGASATKGKEGIAGIDQQGPCVLGRNGGNGSPGANGFPANNLFLYFTELNISGSLTINLNGGDGGDGGDGGFGGSGGPGTRVCEGGNGGNGGNGAHGGNGGDGGNLTIQCKGCPTLRALINKSVIIKNYGGYAGLGGDGGPGGDGGLGPIKDGHNGKRGLSGKQGKEGKNGAITF